MLVIRSATSGVVMCVSLRQSDILMSPSEIREFLKALSSGALAEHVDVIQGVRAVTPATRLFGRGATEHPAVDAARHPLAGINVVEYPTCLGTPSLGTNKLNQKVKSNV